MTQFKNSQESHEHSRKILDILYGYDSFLDSLETVADFGCGNSLDLQWWATLETRDDPPEPRNYKCYAVDKNIKRVDLSVSSLPNVRVIEADLEGIDPPIPRTIDFIWCHDTFQYLLNPLQTLGMWNRQLTPNGMLLLSFPQSTYYEYNRLKNTSRSGCFYNHNIVTLMYMLAVNGFDCKDAYFYKDTEDPWLSAAVYKTDIKPLDPKTTTWFDLADQDLLNDSVVECLNRYGYVKQDEIITTWLNKDFHLPKE
jgi:SAM-dependent methyltransferase